MEVNQLLNIGKKVLLEFQSSLKLFYEEEENIFIIPNSDFSFPNSFFGQIAYWNGWIQDSLELRKIFDKKYYLSDISYEDENRQTGDQISDLATQESLFSNGPAFSPNKVSHETISWEPILDEAYSRQDQDIEKAPHKRRFMSSKEKASRPRAKSFSAYEHEKTKAEQKLGIEQTDPFSEAVDLRINVKRSPDFQEENESPSPGFKETQSADFLSNPSLETDSNHFWPQINEIANEQKPSIRIGGLGELAQRVLQEKKSVESDLRADNAHQDESYDLFSTKKEMQSNELEEAEKTSKIGDLGELSQHITQLETRSRDKQRMDKTSRSSLNKLADHSNGLLESKISKINQDKPSEPIKIEEILDGLTKQLREEYKRYYGI